MYTFSYENPAIIKTANEVEVLQNYIDSMFLQKEILEYRTIREKIYMEL